MIGHQYRGSWPQGNHGPPHHRGRQVSQEQILERIHGNLYSIVGEAVDDVKVEEDKWSRTEIVKRIVGYIYKAAKTPDLMHKPWQEISKTIVHHGMGSYVSACSEKPWFYQLALGNAFTSAVWELVQASARGRPQVHFQDVQDFVVREFEQRLDKSLLTKAVWDATMLTFKDRDIQPKIFKAVHNTYQPALDELLADTRPIDDARKVETFTRRWMETSMQRAWSALESAEQVLSTGQVIRLFQNLIAPFGEGHEYTCIPSMLVDQIGRPPRNWKFLRTAVSKMFEEWHAAQTAPQPSKRRKKGGGGGGEEPEEAEEQEATRDEEEEVPAEEENPPEEEELGDFAAENGTNGAKEEVLEEEDAELKDPWETLEPEDAELEDLDVKDGEDLNGAGGEALPEENGHPECTSAGDCLGAPSDGLVRHMIEGEDGDVYCEACWHSFMFHNPDLEGLWEDGDQAGQRYEAPPGDP